MRRILLGKNLQLNFCRNQRNLSNLFKSQPLKEKEKLGLWF